MIAEIIRTDASGHIVWRQQATPKFVKRQRWTNQGQEGVSENVDEVTRNLLSISTVSAYTGTSLKGNEGMTWSDVSPFEQSLLLE